MSDDLRTSRADRASEVLQNWGKNGNATAVDCRGVRVASVVLRKAHYAPDHMSHVDGSTPVADAPMERAEIWWCDENGNVLPKPIGSERPVVLVDIRTSKELFLIPGCDFAMPAGVGTPTTTATSTWLPRVTVPVYADQIDAEMAWREADAARKSAGKARAENKARLEKEAAKNAVNKSPFAALAGLMNQEA